MVPSKPFRILHVVASLQGGAARHVLDLALGLRARGHETAIAAPADDESALECIRSEEISYYPIPMNRMFFLPSWFRLRRLMASGWTHIHLHGHRAGVIGRMASIGQKRSPILYTLHGYHPPFYPNGFSRAFVNAVERLLARHTDAFICVSSSTRDLLLQAVPTALDRCTVIENGILSLNFTDQERIHLRNEMRNKLGLLENTYVVGAVSRLQWQKGMDRLILAFSDLVHANPLMRLLIVGDGPERASMETLSRENRVQDKVYFIGQRGDARRIYAAMDLFVLPSHWEGLPLTVLEAWDMYTPVLVTDVPGSSELVSHGETGLVVESSVQGLAQGIRQASRDREEMQACAERGRRRLQESFSIDRMVERTEENYSRILRKHLPEE